ncbi:uncharacterized protein [Nicotiana tomentosiformis]|uniref:uncharacterized protein n=1 Tax=Nicotiana tomentosiformis TaxID=4098 RepID=UPI00388C4D92
MANQVTVGALFQEGTSQVRPPYFNRQHFSHWKVRMENYAKSYDVKVWHVIKKENYPLPTAAQPPADPENIDKYTDEKMAVVQVNAKARNLLYNTISGEEYEKISSCDMTKEMWDKLEVTYKGTSKVKETRINMLVHDYELFQIKKRESIEEMFARFSKIIGDLKAFAECPDLKRKVSRGFNKNKSFESWSVEDSSEHKEIANLCLMTILENDMNKYSGCWTDEDASDDECKEVTENYFMERGETSEDWELKLEVCEIERDILQDKVQELQMQLNGMCKSTTHSSVKSNQANYKSTGKGLDGFENTKTILIPVELTNKDPSKLGYLKEGDNSISQEQHRKRCKGKRYLDSTCSSHMTGDKNLLTEVTKINGENFKFGDDSKEKIVGTGTVPFDNSCDIIEDELDQFDKNQVWQLVPKPENATVVGTKWVFQNKLNEEGKVMRNKARLVAQGYSQQKGGDYDETFTPVAQLESIRILLSYASFKGFKLFQIDVKSAFLNGFIDEELAPKESHLIAVKRIIRYLIGTTSYGLWYPSSNNFKLEVFSDDDLAGDKEDRKSTSGTCQLLENALISWNS